MAIFWPSSTKARKNVHQSRSWTFRKMPQNICSTICSIPQSIKSFSKRFGEMKAPRRQRPLLELLPNWNLFQNAGKGDKELREYVSTKLIRSGIEPERVNKCFPLKSASKVNENSAKIHYSYDSMEKQPNVFMKYTISGTRLARTVITKSSNTTGTFELSNLQPSTDYIVEVRTQFPHYASPPCIVNFR